MLLMHLPLSVNMKAGKALLQVQLSLMVMYMLSLMEVPMKQF